MESVPAVAPAQGELAAQNQPRRRAPDESPAEEAADGEGESNAAPAPVAAATSDSDKDSDSDSAPESAESENERPPHRVDSLA